ncbi:MAG: hypothetical protein R3A49_07490 [Acidimicrobiia bacterium]
MDPSRASEPIPADPPAAQGQATPRPASTGTTPNDATVVDAEPTTHDLPPTRDLPVTQAVRETTRFMVGAGLLAGRGAAQLVRRFGTADPGGARSDRAASDPLATPVALAGVARTLAIGATFEVERVLLDTADAVARRTAPVAGVVMRSPLVSPLSRALADRLAGWYARGAMEEQRSREYAGSALLGVTKVGTDFIVEYLDVDAILQSLKLDDLILDSTGGIAGEMLDTVRSQAVTVDSFVDRLTATLTRRTVREGPRSKAEIKAARKARRAARRSRHSDRAAGP